MRNGPSKFYSIGSQKNETTCGDCQPVGRALTDVRCELVKLLKLLILPGS